MSFKYAEKIVDLGLEDCPPSTYKSSTFLAFRYIFEDLEHANNFLPIGIIAPARLKEFKNVRHLGCLFLQTKKWRGQIIITL